MDVFSSSSTICERTLNISFQCLFEKGSSLMYVNYFTALLCTYAHSCVLHINCYVSKLLCIYGYMMRADCLPLFLSFIFRMTFYQFVRKKIFVLAQHALSPITQHKSNICTLSLFQCKSFFFFFFLLQATIFFRGRHSEHDTVGVQVGPTDYHRFR